jgi:GAF domain-containing protein
MVRSSDETLERLVEEQAALRRVATLVARGVRPEEIFAAVSDEVGRLVGTDSATVIRYDEDGEGISYVGSASKVSAAFPVGVHWKFQDGMASFEVYRTGRSARSGAHLISVDGPIGDIHRRMGIISAVASPIVVEGRLWGAMAVHGQEPLPLYTEERLEKFTELVATAIANAEGRVALTRLAEEQAALRRVATLVARGVRPDEIFAAVSDEVGRLVGTDSATVMRYDDGPAIVFVGVASTMSDAYPLGARWEFEDGMASAEVYRTGRSARGGARDWSTLEGPVGETHHRLGIVSTVGSPIVVEGHLWGAIAVQSQEPLPPGTDERLEKFTELVATAIANAESRAELARLAGEQAALRRVATLIARGVPPAEVFSAVAEEVVRLLDAEATAIARGQPDRTIAIIASGGTARDELPVGSCLGLDSDTAIATVLRTGRSTRVDDFGTSSAPVAQRARRLRIRCSVAVPIIVEGALWGSIGAGTNRAQFPADAEQRLEKFTELVATAIANAESREALARLADEQAALRRVATLVAQGIRPAKVFSAVCEEVNRLVDAQATTIGRIEPDGKVTVVAITGAVADKSALGTRLESEDLPVFAAVLQTGRSARKDDYGDVLKRDQVLRDVSVAVGAPIVVDGRLWGCIAVSWHGGEPPPPDTEERMAQFAELLDTAIANADSRDQLTASRARLVTEGDKARRRVVRDLHDGAQQRLVHTIVTLKLAQRAFHKEGGKAESLIGEALGHAQRSNAELRELAHGILPSVLSRGGLRAGVDASAARLDLPVKVDVPAVRFPADVEASAYFIVAEALTNVVKHARAERAEVRVSVHDDVLRVEIRDDGIGGADPDGHGLVGLGDRATALGGRLEIESPAGGGTLVAAAIPLPGSL